MMVTPASLTATRNHFGKAILYLDSHFTGEPGDAHPQWVVIGARPSR